MKKTHGFYREISPFSDAQLELLPTQALLSRLKRLQWCEESLEDSDLSADEARNVPGILFKNTREWRETYTETQAALRGREHIPSPAERRTERLAKLKRGW